MNNADSSGGGGCYWRCRACRRLCRDEPCACGDAGAVLVRSAVAAEERPSHDEHGGINNAITGRGSQQRVPNNNNDDASLLVLQQHLIRARSHLRRDDIALQQQHGLLEEVQRQLESVRQQQRDIISAVEEGRTPTTTRVVPSITVDDERNNHNEESPSAQYQQRITRQTAMRQQDITNSYQLEPLSSPSGAWAASLRRLNEAQLELQRRIAHDSDNGNEVDDFFDCLRSIRVAFPHSFVSYILEHEQQRMAECRARLEECLRELQEQLVALNELGNLVLELHDSRQRRQRPTAQHVLDHLLRITVPPTRRSSSAHDACGICAEMVEPGQVLLQLPCRHSFHDACLLTWLQSHNTCPYCRHALPTEDNDSS